MSLITSRLMSNVPSYVGFERMIKAGLDSDLYAAFHAANGAVAAIIFANVFADINGDYDFVQMNALNRRMASDLALLAAQNAGAVKWFPSQTDGREVAVIDGGKVAAGGAA